MRVISVPSYDGRYPERNVNNGSVGNLNFNSILQAVGPQYSKHEVKSLTINSKYLQNFNQVRHFKTF